MAARDPAAAAAAAVLALPTFELCSLTSVAAGAKRAADYDDFGDDDFDDDFGGDAKTAAAAAAAGSGSAGSTAGAGGATGGGSSAATALAAETTAAAGLLDGDNAEQDFEFAVAVSGTDGGKAEPDLVEVLSWGAGGNGVLGLGAQATARVAPALVRFDEMFELMCVRGVAVAVCL